MAVRSFLYSLTLRVRSARIFVWARWRRWGIFCPEKINNDRRNVGKINFHASKEVTSKRAENARTNVPNNVIALERKVGPFMRNGWILLKNIGPCWLRAHAFKAARLSFGFIFSRSKFISSWLWFPFSWRVNVFSTSITHADIYHDYVFWECGDIELKPPSDVGIYTYKQFPKIGIL